MRYYGGTRRRYRRGGLTLTRDQETAFLKKKQQADREEALHVGDKSLLDKAPAIESVGTGTRAFDPHDPGHAATEHYSDRARSESRGGKTRRRKHRKSRRRR
jgi:hypothetical protein